MITLLSVCGCVCECVYFLVYGSVHTPDLNNLKLGKLVVLDTV